MDECVTIRIDNQSYRLPAIYLESWPKVTQIKKGMEYPSNSSGFSFFFWMPTGRPEEIKMPFPAEFALRERGAKPAQSEYFIEVYHARFYDPGVALPEKGIANLKAFSPWEAPNNAQSHFGLEELIFDKVPLNQFIYFHNVPPAQPHLEFRCVNKALHPGCDGVVYYNDGMSFFLRFSYDHLENWRDIVSMTRRLILSWRQ